MPKDFVQISPSLIGYLFECPRCLWLHFNEGVRRPRGLFPSLPDGMDDIFKKYFDIYRERHELPPEIAGKIDGRLFDDMSKLNIWRNINFGRGGLSAEFFEYKIELRGAIDELVIRSDGKYIPFDFKTRGYPTKDDTHEHYRSQLDLYAILFEKNNLPPAEYGYLLFFWPEKYENLVASFKTDLVKVDVDPKRALKLLAQTRRIIDGPKPEAHTECEYCAYRDAS